MVANVARKAHIRVIAILKAFRMKVAARRPRDHHPAQMGDRRDEEAFLIAKCHKVVVAINERFRRFTAVPEACFTFLRRLRRLRGLKHRIDAAQRGRLEDSLIGLLEACKPDIGEHLIGVKAGHSVLDERESTSRLDGRSIVQEQMDVAAYPRPALYSRCLVFLAFGGNHSENTVKEIGHRALQHWCICLRMSVKPTFSPKVSIRAEISSENIFSIAANAVWRNTAYDQ